MAQIPNQESLKKMFRYNKSTGTFVRRGHGWGEGFLIRGYPAINVGKNIHFKHQLIFVYVTGSLPKRITHINLNRLDNRWVNLKEFTPKKKMKREDITQKMVKKLFSYNRETGDLIRKTNASRQNKGSIAGSLRLDGRLYTSVGGMSHLNHQIIFLMVTGRRVKEIDHIDHNPSNNSWANLREVTHEQNQRNRRIGKNNTSGHIGVYRDKRNGKWNSQIMVNTKCINLGSFNDKSDAIAARAEANIKYGFHANHGAEK